MRAFTWKSGDVRVHFSVREAHEHVLFDEEGVIDVHKVRLLVSEKLLALSTLDDEILIPYCVTTTQPRESFKVSNRPEIDKTLKKIKVIRELITLGSTPALQANLKRLKDQYDKLINE